MTKKHFEMIARIIKDANKQATSEKQKELIEFIAGNFAQELQKTNPLFDIKKFLCAIFF